MTADRDVLKRRAYYADPTKVQGQVEFDFFHKELHILLYFCILIETRVFNFRQDPSICNVHTKEQGFEMIYNNISWIDHPDG